MTETRLDKKVPRYSNAVPSLFTLPSTCPAKVRERWLGKKLQAHLWAEKAGKGGRSRSEGVCLEKEIWNEAVIPIFEGGGEGQGEG